MFNPSRERAKFIGTGGGCDDEGARTFPKKKSEGAKTFSPKKPEGARTFLLKKEGARTFSLKKKKGQVLF